MSSTKKRMRYTANRNLPRRRISSRNINMATAMTMMVTNYGGGVHVYKRRGGGVKL